MNGHGERRECLRERARAKGWDGFIVTYPPNLYWLLGFSGSSGTALILNDRIELLVDGRYFEQARQETAECIVVQSDRAFDPALRKHLPAGAILGFEANHLSYSDYLQLCEWHDGGRLRAASGWLEELRMVKSAQEIALLEHACRQTVQVHEDFEQQRIAGATERELAGLLEFLSRRRGSEGPSFSTIVASGEHSALPHATPRNVSVDSDEVLLVDFGLKLDRYCSDLTRTSPGKTPGVEEIAAVVRRAQEAAIAEVAPGVKAKAVDAAARGVIEGAGYGDRFLHSTGHGLGLEIHEPPRLASGVETLLETGMVITVEPGIYLPGRFGVRIEDVVVVTETGCRLLTSQLE
ncbi:MAG TPA: Xaa-Pro peptidase family protein [Acidobacteriota bacterium]|nr:Xaa-Pro peptidase family protein [Acidobacteriota bacterium]HRR55838.1 Xaa-Pro peptidase family protein [Acidobacteriota bacterium]